MGASWTGALTLAVTLLSVPPFFFFFFVTSERDLKSSGLGSKGSESGTCVGVCQCVCA